MINLNVIMLMNHSLLIYISFYENIQIIIYCIIIKFVYNYCWVTYTNFLYYTLQLFSKNNNNNKIFLCSDIFITIYILHLLQNISVHIYFIINTHCV